jgi:hypothetical protein
MVQTCRNVTAVQFVITAINVTVGNGVSVSGVSSFAIAIFNDINAVSSSLVVTVSRNLSILGLIFNTRRKIMKPFLRFSKFLTKNKSRTSYGQEIL